VLVCDSRKNALLRVGNKNDREDARKLSELLFLNKLHAVYHGETGIRTLKELARSYLTITRDLTRVMNRLKAIDRPSHGRSWANVRSHSLNLYLMGYFRAFDFANRRFGAQETINAWRNFGGRYRLGV